MSAVSLLTATAAAAEGAGGGAERRGVRAALRRLALAKAVGVALLPLLEVVVGNAVLCSERMSCSGRHA